jgi:uncharacterized OB-fold protein
VDLDDPGLPAQVAAVQGRRHGGNVQPYGVGYVDLDGELLVEARLTENDPDRLQLGAEVELVLEPLYREADGTDVLTFAFRPVESSE